MKRATRSGLFLLEMIIMLLFFAVTCAVSVRLFATTSRMSRESADLTRAVTGTESAAEAYQGAGGSLPVVQSILGGDCTADTWAIYYDETMAEVPAQSAVYTLSIRPIEEKNGVSTAEIIFLRGDIPVYSLTTSAFTKGGGIR